MDFKTTPDIDPAIWEHYYEAAIATPNPEVRLQRIAEAQALILRRAEALEEGKATDAECQALEGAAEFLQGLKAASIGNGIGKQVEVGDVEPLPDNTGKPDDPIFKSHRLT
jgi:hypothetical protein